MRRWLQYGLMLLAVPYMLHSGQYIGNPANKESQWHLIEYFRVTVDDQTPQQQCEALKAVKEAQNTNPAKMFKCEPKY